MVELKEPFATLWQGKNPFVEVKKLQGEVFRELETRRTLRFVCGEKEYFLKWHSGTTYHEVFKNLLSFRLPVLGADREWKAIHRLAELGVDTMQGVAYGERGWNPVKKTSFIITEALTPTVSLEDYCDSWRDNPPSLSIKILLIQRVAEMVRKMHLGGVNHRDCYLCHFLLHLPLGVNAESLKISVIDLHRAQIRKKVPLRWRNKDLIGLYFSSSKIKITDRDVYRFLKVYFNSNLREILKREHSFIRQASEKAKYIAERTVRKSL
ncbi:lipopolysaccharide core heptose(I) kinase RfaP [Cedecea neteri]|uniref:Lipopolysaccharide core heptose(I) kinase n=1 Tax=Cedecea neteri TaxID=158822 RepID=A0A291E4A3_9ENTR|nr:lipopolysaccharide core heptose(I) kinase RfaP [Cedecea neteri]ATF94880.1 lipopolysaccharide core heptose(I) kinase RfaP [Cedecea neteri]